MVLIEKFHLYTHLEKFHFPLKYKRDSAQKSMIVCPDMDPQERSNFSNNKNITRFVKTYIPNQHKQVSALIQAQNVLKMREKSEKS